MQDTIGMPDEMKSELVKTLKAMRESLFGVQALYCFLIMSYDVKNVLRDLIYFHSLTLEFQDLVEVIFIYRFQV